MSAFPIFNNDKWPDDRKQLELLYGKGLKLLTEWFKDKLLQSRCQVEEIPGEWRCLKRRVSNDLHGKSYLGLYQTLLLKQPYRDEMQNIVHLVQILLVPPVSSANCERAFSAQKKRKSNVCSSLTSSRLSDLILILTEGPELQQYDPSSAVERWLKLQEKAIC